MLVISTLLKASNVSGLRMTPRASTGPVAPMPIPRLSNPAVAVMIESARSAIALAAGCR